MPMYIACIPMITSSYVVPTSSISESCVTWSIIAVFLSSDSLRRGVKYSVTKSLS